MHAKLPLTLISPYPWSSVSVRTMEAVYLIQTNPEDQGFTNVSVYLDMPETSARLTLMSARLILVFEVCHDHHMLDSSCRGTIGS